MLFLNPQTVLAHLRIPYGARVADFGTGAGHYALAIAERLEGQGTVYALDAFMPALESLSKEAARRNVALHTLYSDFNAHIPLKDGLLNRAVAANVLHQVFDKERFIDELARVLEPKGEILVVDWASSFKNMGPTNEMALSPGEAAQLFKAAGFSVGDMLPSGTHHFAFIAKNA